MHIFCNIYTCELFHKHILLVTIFDKMLNSNIHNSNILKLNSMQHYGLPLILIARKFNYT